MADPVARVRFPTLPAQVWWALRERFKKSIPNALDAETLASMLNTKVNSAQANVIPGLRQVGLIDEVNKVNQSLAVRWRDDAQYAAVCAEMIEKIYPEGLRTAAPDPNVDRAAAVSWFSNKTGQGEAAVTKMVAFYQLLGDARIPDGSKPVRSRESKPAPARIGGRTRKTAKDWPADPAVDETPKSKGKAPEVYINIQVHISADAKPDQIDQVFASMAKHLYAKVE